MSENRYDFKEIQQRIMLGKLVTIDEAVAISEHFSIAEAAKQSFDFGAIEAAKVGGALEKNFLDAQNKRFAEKNPHRRR